MTSEEFIQWLDKEIEEADKLVYKQTLSYEPDGSYEARSNALYEAKEKYLSILTPSSTINY